MDSLRKTALVAGALYLLTFVSIPTLALYGAVQEPNYILGSGPDTAAVLGGVLEIIVALAGIGTAIALYPVVKRQNEGVALGFVGARVLEAATILAGVASLLTIVTLRQAGVGADGLVAGQALVGMYDSLFLVGQSLIPPLNAFLLGSLLYRSGLVPRILSPGRIHRCAPACRWSHRHDVWGVGIRERADRNRRTPDRGMGVLPRRLPGGQGLQALTHHC
ncbi:MAG: DUF4386 domain-containing protein [Acidimicrobiia bacterium]